MSRGNSKRPGLPLICQLLVCLLLVAVVPEAAAENIKRLCSVTMIEFSHNETPPDEIDIKGLQENLKAGGFPKQKLDGKWNKKTKKNLNRFCLRLAAKGLSIPRTEIQKPTPDLYRFLSAQLDAISKKEPEPAPRPAPGPIPDKDDDPDAVAATACDISFGLAAAKSALTWNNIAEAQRYLHAGGYDTGGIDGIPGNDTRQALEQFCQQFFGTGLKRHIIPTLFNFLRNTAAIADVHPGWMMRLHNEAFLSWVQQGEMLDYNSLNDMNAIMAVAESETGASEQWVDQVIAMLSGFPGKPPQLESVELKTPYLTGDDCGCSREYSKKGDKVYGFYPYWDATGDKTKRDKLDFSLYDRLGFFALKVAATGKLQDPLQWDDNTSRKNYFSDFIQQAHKHRVKVDLTFYLSDWERWDPDVYQVAAATILQTSGENDADETENLLQKLSALLEGTTPVKADGINLYFDNYSDSTHSEKLIAIVNALRDEMHKNDSNIKLNLILDINWPQISAQLFSDLHEIILPQKITTKGVPSPVTKEDPAEVDQLLLFLAADTSASKKILRLSVEDAFHGESRRSVLRKIIPVIPADNALPPAEPAKQDDDKALSPAEQFDDDLIYFEDNFGGVGLWPSEREDPDNKIGEALAKEFLQAGNANILMKLAGRLETQLCQFACPNRWYFRIALDLLIASWVLYGLVAIWSCRLREVFRQKIGYFYATGGVTVLDLVIMSICDPFWQALTDSIVFGILVVIVALLIGRRVARSMRAKLP